MTLNIPRGPNTGVRTLSLQLPVSKVSFRTPLPWTMYSYSMDPNVDADWRISNP
jgi:hypothetical protein